MHRVVAVQCEVGLHCVVVVHTSLVRPRRISSYAPGPSPVPAGVGGRDGCTDSQHTKTPPTALFLRGRWGLCMQPVHGDVAGRSAYVLTFQAAQPAGQCHTGGA